MTSEERLPPRRELPGDVRERLRDDVLTRLGRPRRGRWAPVAAAVVLLVGGVAVGTQMWRVEPPQELSGPASDPAAHTLDRCWAAAQLAGKADRLPARESWGSPTRVEQGDHVGIAFLAAGKPAFCETTATTVTLTNPDAQPAYAEGSRTALMLYTSTGLAAGIADPAWARIELSREDGLGHTMEEVTKDTHLFISLTQTPPAMGALWAGRWDKDQFERTWPRAELPAPPPPLFSVTDQAGERTSPAGQALKDCLDGLTEPLADAGSYQAGILLESGNFRLVPARNAVHSIACTTGPDPTRPEGKSSQVHVDTFTGKSISVRRMAVPELGGKVPFVGIVPQSGASMVADFGTGKPENVPVANGTFATWLPDSAKAADARGEAIWVKPLDTDGKTLFNGWVGGK
jgi:hypothetical protein